MQVSRPHRFYLNGDRLSLIPGTDPTAFIQGSHVLTTPFFSVLPVDALDLSLSSNESQIPVAISGTEKGILWGGGVGDARVEGPIVLVNEQLLLNISVPENQTLSLAPDSSLVVWSRTVASISHVDLKGGVGGTDHFAPNGSVEVDARVELPFGREELLGMSVELAGREEPMQITGEGDSWVFGVAHLSLGTLAEGQYTVHIIGVLRDGVKISEERTVVVTSEVAQPIFSSGGDWFVSAGAVLEIPRRITNGHATQGDIFQLTGSANLSLVKILRGDGLPLNDTDGDGVIDTGVLGPRESLDLLLHVQVPLIEEGIRDEVTISARSTLSPDVQATSQDAVFVQHPAISREDVSLDGVIIPTFTNNLVDTIAVSLSSTYQTEVTVHLTVIDDTSHEKTYDVPVKVDGKKFMTIR